MIQMSFIVSVLDSHEVVRRQLLHLDRVLTPDCELILVDDGSSPPLRAVCEAVPKRFAFVLHETHDHRPWTQPRARNRGAALASAEKLVFFDIDHVLTASVVTACRHYPGDKLHWIRRPALLDQHGQLLTDAATLAARGPASASPSVHGNSFMIRRRLFQRLGGYDERFCGRYGGDDLDFNARYDRLCTDGLAWPAEVRGEGYVYTGDRLDDRVVFHALPRGSGARGEPPVTE
jgi:predicted glycosyltransferase involved in capsule biosynthesis